MAPDCAQPLLYNIYSLWQVSAPHVSACTIRVKLWLSTRIKGMKRKECKTCLKSLQSTPCLDWLAQPTNTTEPTKQCVVLTGTPILVASRTVNAAPSSIVNPLEVKQLNYIARACNNINSSWGRKLAICLYLVLGFSKHSYEGASLRTCIRTRNSVISVIKEVYINTLHITQRAIECTQHPT
jgi:hypothetical protein